MSGAYLWKAYVAGRSNRSCASTSELAACSSLSAMRLMCARVELLCKEYTAPQDTCTGHEAAPQECLQGDQTSSMSLIIAKRLMRSQCNVACEFPSFAHGVQPALLCLLSLCNHHADKEI